MKRLIALFLFTALLNNSCGQSQHSTRLADPIFEQGKQMDEQEFWKIINYSHVVSGKDLQTQSKVVIERLSNYTAQQIIDFEIIFEKAIIKANDYKILASETIIYGMAADDDFLYFRCWLIGQGQATFEQAIKNPDDLADVTSKGVEPDFEDLMYAATDAYKAKTGKTKEDDTFPRGVAYSKGLNYDFDAPKITGKEWKKDELPKLYPKLWNKFN